MKNTDPKNIGISVNEARKSLKEYEKAEKVLARIEADNAWMMENGFGLRINSIDLDDAKRRIDWGKEFYNQIIEDAERDEARKRVMSGEYTDDDWNKFIGK